MAGWTRLWQGPSLAGWWAVLLVDPARLLGCGGTPAPGGSGVGRWRREGDHLRRFLLRAAVWFTGHGVTVGRVMTERDGLPVLHRLVGRDGRPRGPASVHPPVLPVTNCEGVSVQLRVV